MAKEKVHYKKLDYNEYAKTQDPTDFWRQVRRTVKGEPVSDDQINMIVRAIKTGAKLAPDDILLDLACGNGALSRLLFDSCKEFLGVDCSEYLITIAKDNFEVSPNYSFLIKYAAEYVRQEQKPERFSKVICYGSFSYFSESDAAEILKVLFEKFINVQTIFIGNVPDRERASEFYQDRLPEAGELSDCSSQIGIWWLRSKFELLASNAGWNARFLSMPGEFFAASYRYDVVLTR